MPKHLLYVGRCTWQCTPFPSRYVALTIEGDFALPEANQYILHLLDQPFALWTQFFQAAVQVRFLYFFAEHEDLVLDQIQYYLDHYSVVDFVDTQEWLSARDDLEHKIRTYVVPKQGAPRIVVGSLVENLFPTTGAGIRNPHPPFRPDQEPRTLSGDCLHWSRAVQSQDHAQKSSAFDGAQHTRGAHWRDRNYKWSPIPIGSERLCKRAAHYQVLRSFATP